MRRGRNARNRARGFSLVELLVIVLIIAVLGAIAIPLYINVRASSAARVCASNLSAVTAIESAYAVRHSGYATMATLLASYPAAFAGAPACPLHSEGNAYTGLPAADGERGAITITCPFAEEHSQRMHGNTTSTTQWVRGMPAVAMEQN